MLLFNVQFLCFWPPLSLRLMKLTLKEQLALATTVTVHTNLSGMSEERLGNKTLHHC